MRDEFLDPMATRPVDPRPVDEGDQVDDVGLRPKRLAEFQKVNQNQLALDGEGNLAFLAEGEWLLKYVGEKWPEIVFHTTRELR